MTNIKASLAATSPPSLASCTDMVTMVGIGQSMLPERDPHEGDLRMLVYEPKEHGGLGDARATASLLTRLVEMEKL